MNARFNLLLAALALMLFNPRAARSQDYLPPDLRTEVEQLKRDARREPTSDATAADRARLLWRWLNAHALSGRYVPVNATSDITRVMNAAEEREMTRPQLRSLDDLIRELSVIDEQPDALGAISISSRGPFPILSWQTVEVTYAVGKMPIEAGGVVMLARQFMSDSGRWQANNPRGDNYVSIRASRTGARFMPDRIRLAGMHGGFRSAVNQLAFRLDGASLREGDTLTITYGDTSGGGRGFRMQSFSNDAAALPIYIQFRPDDIFFSLPLPTYEVVGGEFNAVHGFVPSVVGIGEAVDVRVRAEDRYYNRATGAIPALEVLLNGEPHSRLAGGSEAIQVISGVKFNAPGVYRFSFRAGGKEAGASDPILALENPEWRLYWGETHGHCGFAEGQGTPDGFFTFGRDDARLDFLTLSEHDIWMDDYEWKVLNEAAGKYTEEGKFIVFPGYEWTSTRALGGHHNVFFRRTGFDRVGVQSAPHLTDLYVQLHSKYEHEDVLIIPHAHQAADWRMSNPDLERLVEIMSMHGTFEWFGNHYLERGHEVGFIAASDDHLSHPGYSTGSGYGSRMGSSLSQRGGLAAVYARELTTDDVFDSLRARRAYATSGSRMILNARLNDAEMGTRQPFAEMRTVKGTVHGTSPIDTIELVKNGEVIDRREYLNGESGDRLFLEIGFASQSDAIGRDNPRGYRPWVGWVEIAGAKLDSVSAPGFHQPRHESVEIDSANPNKAHFSTMTRGRMNNMLLEIAGATAQTRIRIYIEEGDEFGKAPPQVRGNASLPSEDFTWTLGDLRAGALTREFKVDLFRDEITMRAVNPNAALDREFEFIDSAEPLPGDYYYVRVRQFDGGLAWTSPFWVGGETPR